MSKALLLCCALMLSASAVYAQNSDDDPANMTNISFKDISAKESLKNLARNISRIVELDESLKDRKITLQVSEITIAKAFEMILVMRGWRAKQKEDGTILVYADDAEARKRYEKYVDWTHRSLEKR